MGIKNGDKCPRCEGVMRMVPGSDRTVPGGTWYVLRCFRCGHTVWDAFKPRRSKKQ